MATLKFGKYKGQQVSEVRDMKYLNWLAKPKSEFKEGDFVPPDDCREEAQAILKDIKGREKGGGSRPATRPSPQRVEDNSGLKEKIEGMIAEAQKNAENETTSDMVMYWNGYETGLYDLMETL